MRRVDRIIWMPTFRCNLRCSYCMARSLPLDKHGEEVAPERWIEMFNSPDVEIGIMAISGGEPTMYPGLREILDATTFRYSIDTNMMSHPRQWLVLDDDGVASRLYAANMSLHFHPQTAMAEKVFERMRWVTERVPAKSFLGSAYVMTQKDPPDEYDMVSYAMSEKAPGVKSVRVTFGDVFMFRTIQPRWDGRAEWCESGQKHCVIFPDGTVYRCLGHSYFGLYPMGNLFVDGWDVLLDNPEACDYLLCSTCDKSSREIVDGSGDAGSYLSSFKFRGGKA